MTPIQRFAYRVSEANRIFAGLGAEVRASAHVAPFAEWTLEVPVGLTVGRPDIGFSAYPQILTLGARIFPWRGLPLLVALDVGITWNGRVGVPGVPPWQALVGVGWSFGGRRAPRTVEKEEDF
jgi:hypothetical protein